MYSGWPRSSTGVSVRVTVCVSACDHLADPPASITQNRTLPSGPPSRPVTTVNSTCTGPTANCSPDSRAACASRSSARKPATNAATGTRPSSSPTVTLLDDSSNRGTARSRPEPHPASHSGTRREGGGLHRSRDEAAEFRGSLAEGLTFVTQDENVCGRLGRRERGQLPAVRARVL